MGFWDGSGISWTICKQSAPRSRQTTTPTPHHCDKTETNKFCTLYSWQNSYIHMLTAGPASSTDAAHHEEFSVGILITVLWRCWLGGRKGIRPVKTEWCGAGEVICLERGADLHMVQLMPLPLTVSCFSKIQIGFTFLVPAHLGSTGQSAVKRVCVCVFW